MSRCSARSRTNGLVSGCDWRVPQKLIITVFQISPVSHTLTILSRLALSIIVSKMTYLKHLTKKSLIAASNNKVLRSTAYHLWTLVLFTWSDFKTTLIPVVGSPCSVTPTEINAFF